MENILAKSRIKDRSWFMAIDILYNLFFFFFFCKVVAAIRKYLLTVNLTSIKELREQHERKTREGNQLDENKGAVNI